MSPQPFQLLLPLLVLVLLKIVTASATADATVFTNVKNILPPLVPKSEKKSQPWTKPKKLSKSSWLPSRHKPTVNNTLLINKYKKKSGNITSRFKSKNKKPPSLLKSANMTAAQRAAQAREKIRIVMDTRFWQDGYLKAAESIVSDDNHIIVTSGDWGYRLVVLNWMLHMDKLNITEYVILCYDKELLNLIGHWSKPGGHGILCSQHQEKSLNNNALNDTLSGQQKFALKHIGVNLLVKQGYITTWSDADCVWLKPFINTHILPYKDTLDIISAMGKHPVDISKKIGVASCIGLFTVFPTTASKYFYVEMLARGLLLDDQTSFNYLLGIMDGFHRYSDIIPYGHEPDYTHLWINNPRTSAQLKSTAQRTGDLTATLDFGDLAFFKKTIFLPKYTLRHGFLPYNKFPRGLSKKKSKDNFAEMRKQWTVALNYEPCIWHLLSQKNGKSKTDGFKADNVYMLTDRAARLVTLEELTQYMKTLHLYVNVTLNTTLNVTEGE